MLLEGPDFILRPFKNGDTEDFSQLNQDPEVMRYFPRCLNPEESTAMMQRINQSIRRHRFGFFALEDKNLGFVGFVGCKHVDFDAPLNPSIEIGWRLAHKAWGVGLATRAASVVLNHMFNTLGVPQVTAFTATSNKRSYRVMERLGMCRAADFQHPRLDADDPLSLHRGYFLSEKMWATLNSSSL